MSRLLVFGGAGQLARELVKLAGGKTVLERAISASVCPAAAACPTIWL